MADLISQIKAPSDQPQPSEKCHPGRQLVIQSLIGSGIVEAGCKKVIGARFKCSGMFWGEPGARNLLHIRTALLSQTRFDDFWAARSAA